MTDVIDTDAIWDSLRPEPPMVNGRYVIVPPGEKKSKTYQRVSNFKRPAMDTYNFEKRDKRMVAVGIATRPELALGVASCDPEKDKGELDKICKAAEEAAGSTAKAKIGTAIHRITQRVDLGETVTIPAAYQADIDAYQAALAANGLTVIPEYVERTCVIPEFQVAGTFDRLYQLGTTLFVGDIKTGSVDFGFGDMTVAGALYSHASTIYDPVTQTHQPMPDNLDKDVGLIVHLPAGKGICDLYWIDLKAGWEAAQHCAWIRSWRSRRDLAERWSDDEPCSNHEVRRVRIIQRISTLKEYPGALDQLAAWWNTTGIPTFQTAPRHTSEQLDLISLAVAQVEAAVEAPFGPLDPAHKPTPTPT